MDIARLGFVVDSSEVKQATRDVEGLGDAAGDTQRDVERASQGIAGASGRIQQSLSGAASKSSAAWSRFKQSFSGAGGVSTAIASLGVAGVFNRMIEDARSAEEAQALFEQVFQDNAASVRAWADDLAGTINRSSHDLQSQAAMFQQVLASLVPDRGQAAEMSTVLAGLAQDIAAFYDISEGEALAKLRSGLVGETEPLKQLGIVLSAASVEAKALEMGLAGTAAALTDADKVAARYALIMDRTADAQGAATREAEGLTNQQRGLAGAIGDLQRSLGQHLLPIMTSLVSHMADTVRAFNTLSPATQKFIAYAIGLAAAIGPAVTALGVMALAIPPITAAVGLLLSPIGLAVAAIAGLTVAGVALYRNWDELKARFPVIQRAIDGITGAFDKFRRAITVTVDALRPLAGFMRDNLQSAFRAVAALLRGDFVGAFQEMRTQSESNMNALRDLAGPWARSVVDAIKDGLAGLYQAGVEAIADLARGLRESVTGLIEDAKGWGSNIAAGIRDGIKGGASRVTDAVGGLASSIRDRFRGDTEQRSPSRLFMRLGRFLTEGLAIGIESGSADAVGAMRGVADQTISVADELRDGLKGVFSSVIDGSKSVPEAIGDMLEKIADKLMNSGIDHILSALFGGFGRDPLSDALAAIPGLAGGTRNFAGGLAMVGERGPELVRLPRGAQVHSSQQTRQMMRGGEPQQVVVRLDLSADLDARIDQRSQGVAVQVTRQGLSQYDRQVLPARVSQINDGPRRRG